MLSFKKSIRIRTAAVIIENKKILLVAHLKNDKKYWLLPGGGVEYGESLTKSLSREILEELNVHVKIGDVLYIYDSLEPSGKRHIVNICMSCRRLGGNIQLGDDKRLVDYNFFSYTEAEKLLIIPAFKKELLYLISDKKSGIKRNDKIYLGEKWVKL